MRIPIHLISSFFYCPFKAYLEYRRIKGEETKEMIIGRRWHEILEEEHKKRANMRVSIKDAIKMTRVENISIVFREVPVEEEVLYGRIDELIITPKFFMIIDDKPRFSEGYKLQVLFYAYAFAKSFIDLIDRPIIVAIRKRENKKYFWCDAFNKEYAILVDKYKVKLMRAVSGDFTFEVDIRKCSKCSLKNICPLSFLYYASRNNKARGV